ncbi:MAG: hypothetical protein ABF263_04380 [Polaribacter sp.]
MKTFTLLTFFTLFMVFSVYGQEETLSKIPKRIYTTKRLVKKPIIDGKINEDARFFIYTITN